MLVEWTAYTGMEKVLQLVARTSGRTFVGEPACKTMHNSCADLVEFTDGDHHAMLRQVETVSILISALHTP